VKKNWCSLYKLNVKIALVKWKNKGNGMQGSLAFTASFVSVVSLMILVIFPPQASTMALKHREKSKLDT